MSIQFLIDILAPILITILAWFATNHILFLKSLYRLKTFDNNDAADQLYVTLTRANNKTVLVYEHPTLRFLFQCSTYQEFNEFFKTNHPHTDVYANQDEIEEMFGES